MSDIDLINHINDWCSAIESKTALKCPDTHTKNVYLKACWILTLYRKMQYAGFDQRFEYQGMKIGEVIKALTHFLPELRRLST